MKIERQYAQVAGFNEMYARGKTATTNTAYLVGLNAKILTCTVTCDPNGDVTDIVGRDKRDRTYDAWCRNLLIGVRSARNLLGLPGGFTVAFDHRPPSNARPGLAIVAACVLAAGRETYEFTPHTLYLGELGYTDTTACRIMTTRGVLPILESVEGFTHAFVPHGNAIEAGANTNRITCTTLANVHDLIDPSSRTRGFAPKTMDLWEPLHVSVGYRGLSDVTIAELTAAARSDRNALIVGVNAWKASQTFHELLNGEKRLSGSEAHGVACLHSAVGLLTDGKIPTVRPFRAPHHSIEERNLAGSFDRPGEVSLAAHGTLVLDHVLDFKRTGLEWLKNIVKTNVAMFARKDECVEYPAKCRIVGTVYPDEVRFLTPDRVAFLGDYVRVDV
jgi:predicted ATPase with chaperone activity